MKQRKPQVGHVITYLVAGAVFVVAVAVGWYVIYGHHRTNTTNTANGSVAITSGGSHGAVDKSLSSGTSNGDLGRDLQNINDSLSESGQQLQSAGSSLNDQQLPVNDN